MDSKKNTSGEERILFLEKELERLEEELLQKVREIEVEKALEKVRAKALDMRTSSELSETSIILFQQLKELKIDAIRSGVGIFDDEGDAIELWVTSVADDGKLFFILDYINIHVHPVFENIISSREQKKPYAVTKLEGADLLNYYRKMSTYIKAPKSRDNANSEFYYSFFFSAGTINVVTNKELSEEEANIMLRMANVFGLIYTRFQDLKKTEDQAQQINEEKMILEKTLQDLKAMQSQLIQSEKMASLGELTAGIAHEIQNPLNFVNNFSEVNIELIGELQQELKSGNNKAAIEISTNIELNEEKINHHGKRADSIVKSMLQHSRSGTANKEPTDINTLADDFLKLAYHGLRAKDNSFIVTLKTDFDNSIEKMNIMQQEIGRVMLNLINNAFYAVSEKRKQSRQPYEPTITVTTKKSGTNIEIHIKDNGNGIPQKVLDKIFQPFFTTKPTGEGTGLGLSLCYDIVKAHDGEIKVKTTEGEFTEFIIILPF